jgi:hypothetical protein
MKGQAIRCIFFYNTHATPKKDAAAVLCAKQLKKSLSLCFEKN